MLYPVYFEESVDYYFSQTNKYLPSFIIYIKCGENDNRFVQFQGTGCQNRESFDFLGSSLPILYSLLWKSESELPNDSNICIIAFPAGNSYNLFTYLLPDSPVSISRQTIFICTAADIPYYYHVMAFRINKCHYLY